jgi:hypothetical protein
MAQWVLEFRKSPADAFVAPEGVAAVGTGGGVALLRLPDAGVDSGHNPIVVRFDSSGAVTWTKFVPVPSDVDTVYGGGWSIASRGSYVAVGWNVTRTTGALACADIALLNISDGSVVWQKRLEDFTLGGRGCLAMATGGVVYVTGEQPGGGAPLPTVVKLALAGTISWAQGLSSGLGSANQSIGSIAVLSDDDVIVSATDKNTSTPEPRIVRLNASDGVVVFATEATPTLTATDDGLASAYFGGTDSYLTYYVPADGVWLMKFDGTGANTWQKKLTSTASPNVREIYIGKVATGDLGTHLAGDFDDTVSPFDFFATAVLISASGAVTKASRISAPVGYFYKQQTSDLASSGQMYALGEFPDGADSLAAIVAYGSGDADPVTYNTLYDRVAESVAIANDTEFTTGSYSITAYTTPTPTLSTPTVAAVTRTLATTLVPSGLYMTGVGVGAPSTAFGLPALPLRATGFRSTGVGLPYAVDYGPPATQVAYAIGFRGTRFGSPAAAITGQNAQLSTDPSTTFGAARAVLRQAAATIGQVTQFGTAGAALRQRPSGFSTTTFGTPRTASIAAASGFTNTRFGTPRAPGAIYGRYYDIEGFNGTQFGTPTARRRQAAASIAPTTTFGTVNGLHAQGFSTTQFGLAKAVVLAHPQPWAPSTQFGTPRAPGAIFGRYYDLEGFSTTEFGAARARLRQPATTIGAGTQFGTPGSRMVARGQGFKVTQFGLAQANFTTYASGFISGGFGTPRAPGAVLGAGGLPFGFSTTAFGTPRAVRGVSGAVAGFSSTAFGTPSAVQRHLARSLRPGTRFGVPYVARTCPP